MSRKPGEKLLNTVKEREETSLRSATKKNMIS
jgi:hypothetical protein